MNLYNKKMTCFVAHKENEKSCQNNSCRFWHDLDNEDNNCIINKVNDSKSDFTLEEVGKLFNITRMRVCQIEKSVLLKIKKSLIC
jgi:DNA-directed RNA polymerase sigma subunit (sigma70/sigma32)